MSFFDRFRKLSLENLLKSLINNEIEIVLENGLSFKGKLTTVFSLSLNKETSIYVTLVNENVKNLIKANDVTVIQKRTE